MSSQLSELRKEIQLALKKHEFGLRARDIGKRIKLEVHPTRIGRTCSQMQGVVKVSRTGGISRWKLRE